MGITLKDIYNQREMLRRGEEIARAAKQAEERERLRDHFAAAALTGLLVNANGDIDEDTLDTPSDLAYTAYEMADAMLRERGNHSEKPNSSTNHDAAPAATAVSTDDRTDKAATSQCRDRPGNTPVTEPMPKEKLAEVSDSEPAAWAVTMGDGSVYEAFAAHQRDEAVELAYRCRFGDTGKELPLAPLHFAPTLTDEEREAVGVAIQCLMAAESQRHPEEERDRILLSRTHATLRKLLERLK